MKEVYVCITGDVDGNLENKKCIEEYLKVLEKYNIKATFPTTLETLQFYPERIKKILDKGHEIAGHGDVHKKFYGSLEDQVKRLIRMKEGIYDILGIEIKGFRAPWCKWDKNTHPALFEVGLEYDSSIKRLEILFRLPLIRKRNHEIMFYRYLRPFLRLGGQIYNYSQKCSNYPYYLNSGILEIPLLGYSDYYLIKSANGPRYEKKNELEKIAVVWIENLKFLLRTGGVLVVNAHPSLISPDYVGALDYFMRESLKFGVKFDTLSSLTQKFSGFRNDTAQ